MAFPSRLVSLSAHRLSVRATVSPRFLRPFHHSPVFNMKGARVTSWGSPPEYLDLPDLPAPTPSQLRIRVLAVGVPRVVQGRAARLHPSAFHESLPFDPSMDGVGQDEATGDLYFISTGAAPAFSEYVNVECKKLIKLEDTGSDPKEKAVAVAALVNATQASYIAFRCRTIDGSLEGRTVAILGATSKSGRCAAKVARILGAKTIVGLSRDPATLATVEELDERVVLTEKEPPKLPSTLGPLHVVLDFVGGPAAVQLLQTAETDPEDNLQYILAGWLSGCETLEIPGRLINSRPIRIMGSGMGSFSMKDVIKEMPGFVRTLVAMGPPPFEVLKAPLSEVQTVWNSEDAKNKRLVLLP